MLSIADSMLNTDIIHYQMMHTATYDRSKLFQTICDPTQVNEADVITGPNCDFAVKAFYRNQESF